MKLLSGFGKNYFTLSAILAYSVQNSLQSQVSRMDSFIRNKISCEKDELDDNDPPCENSAALYGLNKNTYHCNCYFKLITKLALLINIFIPRCPYYTTYFAFRRTGTHPPYLS